MLSHFSTLSLSIYKCMQNVVDSTTSLPPNKVLYCFLEDQYFWMVESSKKEEAGSQELSVGP
jgi:hypothetical protein